MHPHHSFSLGSGWTSPQLLPSWEGSSGQHGLRAHAVRLLGPMCKVYVFHAGVSEASGKKIFPGRGCDFIKTSCLENPRDGGAWWATVYGVAESDTTEMT